MTTGEIITRLRAVAAEMASLGVAMDYYGGFNGLMAQHGREMVGAAGIAREWADEIEASSPAQ